MLIVNDQFFIIYESLRQRIKEEPPRNRREWQSLNVSQSTLHRFHELIGVNIHYTPPRVLISLQSDVKPDLPWAEDHFKERIGGKPLNPPPSHQEWPGHKGQFEMHMHNGKFSHTYPERMWPKRAGTLPFGSTHQGIRYGYGDLNDLIQLLEKNIYSRQAYLPIWFPEDTGASEGQRTPCTLGYHFQWDFSTNSMACHYFIRSCDLIRHFRNDVYLAIRLLQWLCHQLDVPSGDLYMCIANLHALTGDLRAHNKK